MAQRTKFDETKYTIAIRELAKQIVAMAQEDYGADGEEYQTALEEYAGDTIIDLKSKIKELA